MTPHADKSVGNGKHGTVRLDPDYPIYTPRLELRPLTSGDLDGLLSYRSLPDVCRYLPFEPMTEAVLKARLASDLTRRVIEAEGQAATLGVHLRSTQVLIGDVVLFLRSVVHRGGELGYVFHPDAAGHGYATEASAAMLELAFGELGLHRVIARLDARNTASARLAARLGMRQEAHFVRDEWFKGEWSDTLVYAMLAQEWHGPPR
jgi:RimJ/RimL family protein N-acetyltransferase